MGEQERFKGRLAGSIFDLCVSVIAVEVLDTVVTRINVRRCPRGFQMLMLVFGSIEQLLWLPQLLNVEHYI